MKFISLLAVSFITISVFAQQPTSLQLSRENRLSNLTINKPIDNMPSANVGPTNQTFLYNNNGLDVYKSQPDNMPVVKPDGSYIDNMCIKSSFDTKAFLNLFKTNNSNQFQPSGKTKFNFVMPSKKDSIAFIDSIKPLQLKPKF